MSAEGIIIGANEASWGVRRHSGYPGSCPSEVAGILPGDGVVGANRLVERSGRFVTWHPYLPEPQPAFRFDQDDPEPVELEVLRELRDCCAMFPRPPREFRCQILEHGLSGLYQPETDIVAVDPDRAARGGMGGDDGYYAVFLHELLHATGHRSRLARATTGDYSPEGYALEEGTVLRAQRIVLEEIGFNAEALDWHAPSAHGLPVDPRAASDAAAWILRSRADVTEEHQTPDRLRLLPGVLAPTRGCAEET